MSTAQRRPLLRRLRGRSLPPGPLAPALLAAVIAVVYLIWQPATRDLAAHLFRAKLFSVAGVTVWDNWWYGGHHTPGYSVLFPPVEAGLGPRLAGALAVVATAALFEPLARARFGRAGTIGALLFAAGAATDLFTNRLTYAFGLLFTVATALALQRRRDGLAALAALLSALGSPVAALFSALAGAAAAAGRAREAGSARAAVGPLLVAGAALLPVVVLTVLFPEGGVEPFAFPDLWPVLVVSAIVAVAAPREDTTLRVAAILYGLGSLSSYLIHTAVGGNVVRLAPMVGLPLAVMLWWPRHRRVLLLVSLPLLYYQWLGPVSDIGGMWGKAGAKASYYRPLLTFLRGHAGGGPFRVEIPFTDSHWETYYVAPYFPLARGWERQLDEKDDPLFYGAPLNPITYRRWLDSLAVRYVAVAAHDQDASSITEARLIAAGLPYLRLVARSGAWTIYAVRNPTPLAQGVATATAIRPQEVDLTARRPGQSLVRVRFSPYWALSGGRGCVAPAGEFTRVTVRAAGPVRLVIRFSLDRIGARSPRCD